MTPLDLSFAPASHLGEMWDHPFVRYAFIAGTAIAVNAGLIGWFVILRGQLFAGDALGHVAFTGALAALAAGIDLRIGLFGATLLVALLLAGLGKSGRADDVVIGSVFAWVLGLGVLFLSIFATAQASGNSGAGVRVLFGSIFGLDAGDTLLLVVVAAAISVALLAIARPLLFATLDEAVAISRGVPARALGFGFLGLVGLTTAQGAQGVGALLVLGLMAAPAGAAQQLTNDPYRGLAISAVVATLSVWVGLTLSYAAGDWPPSFCIIAVATAIYAAAAASRPAVRAWRRHGRQPAP